MDKSTREQDKLQIIGELVNGWVCPLCGRAWPWYFAGPCLCWVNGQHGDSAVNGFSIIFVNCTDVTIPEVSNE